MAYAYKCCYSLHKMSYIFSWQVIVFQLLLFCDEYNNTSPTQWHGLITTGLQLRNVYSAYVFIFIGHRQRPFSSRLFPLFLPVPLSLSFSLLFSHLVFGFHWFLFYLYFSFFHLVKKSSIYHSPLAWRRKTSELIFCLYLAVQSRHQTGRPICLTMNL